MSSRIQIVKSIEDKCETPEPFDIELRVFNIGMVSFDLDIRVEFACSFFCDLGWNC